ncbi:MAG: peptidoglycan recognition family protein [Chthoniobacterales bacterium]
MKRLLSFSRWKGGARFVCLLCLLVAWGSAVVGTLLQAQISDAAKKKRDAFLKAREEMRTVGTPTPSKSPKPKGKPKAAKKKKKGSAASSKKKSSKRDDDDDDDKATPRASKRPKASEDDATSSKKSKSEEDDDTPPRGASTPKATPDLSPPLPKPEPSQSRNLPPADITIQKSGVEEEQGFEPPPPPPPKRSFWSRLFGGGGGERNYRYLNRSVIDAIRRAPVQRSRWKFIIVHNSGTRQGNAKAFDYYHKKVRRMQNGMAYHFVVGNGRSSGDGEIEIGSRWTRQINGGHVHSDYLNNISLGICLVGDFNRDKPTAAQLAATEELIRYLRDRCGKADGRAIPVRPHREMNPPRYATDCPGDAFPYSWFRRF